MTSKQLTEKQTNKPNWVEHVFGNVHQRKQRHNFRNVPIIATCRG